MPKSGQTPITVIADDFTGSMDSGVKFVNAGFATALLLSSEAELPLQVQVISTDSRDTDVETARSRVTEALARCRDSLIFKKIDSTMRGHVGAEIETILALTGIQKTVICPAVIDAGRTICKGQLWVDNTLLHHSDFAHDPTWPAHTATLSDLINLPTTHLSLDLVRGDADQLAQTIRASNTPIITADACQHSDLIKISRATITSDSLPCGALSLAQAWIELLVGGKKVEARPTTLARPGPILIIAGSRHPMTQNQIRQLALARSPSIIEVKLDQTDLENCQKWQASLAALSTQLPLVIRTPQETVDCSGYTCSFAQIMAELTSEICKKIQLGALILTGGETAQAVCHALQATAVQIMGELEIGIPYGRLIGGTAPDLPVVTKAGGFGQQDSLINLIDLLTGDTRNKKSES